jgi:hypothetical protein
MTRKCPCGKHVSFNYEGESMPICCSKCKKDGMIDIRNNKCVCGTIPVFNYDGEKAPICCNKCKKDGMINIRSKKCSCGTSACFNYKGENVAICCSKCKKEGMIDIKNKKCPCGSIPVFNYKEENFAICCNKCKKEGMINIKDKRCPCGTQICFNYEGEKMPICCNKCKKEGMVNIKKNNNKCCCGIRSSFNYEGENVAICCSKCKKEGMIDIHHKKCPCDTIPSFNYEGQKIAICCNKCKKEGMINIKDKNKMCVCCGLTRGNQKYKLHCLRCFIYMFPDEQVCRNYKTKEKSVTDFIKLQFPSYKWICDKQIQNGCSKRRPDMLLEIDPFNYIIIEIDENQHDQYDCLCENKRLMQLSQDLNHSNIVFIRFNPDSYKDSNNKTIRSPWTMTKNTGILSINKNQKEWHRRLDVIKTTIDYWINNKSNKMIEIIQLFFDQV